MIASDAASLALRIEGVSHSFGDTEVLKNVSLQVPTGHITALLGPSGVGKTTLLRIVSGFESPTSGTIEIGGRVVVRDGQSIVQPERRGGALVPQEGALFPHLTVGENVAFGLPNRRSSARRPACTNFSDWWVCRALLTGDPKNSLAACNNASRSREPWRRRRRLSCSTSRSAHSTPP